jgi:hypothetical protein
MSYILHTVYAIPGGTNPIDYLINLSSAGIYHPVSIPVLPPPDITINPGIVVHPDQPIITPTANIPEPSSLYLVLATICLITVIIILRYGAARGTYFKSNRRK